ncbi:class I SAM-dependent methyltransferase [Lutibaculum baratangense]|uniref:Uncharacterized protein n=1 Tax=Lutibaculum baratangense AMV1 TaxID=631454 RepID=V4RCR4_9HYPH|nr:SAM-dependent methyltransferase [Lutibaculum baratangense]ESR23189.1 hypothetical protein N177_3257 [Lutibaculum baratangense AMV1]
MNRLEELIHGEIDLNGPMRLDRYMALALGHPEHGYYMSRPAIGQSGDFTTAPEVSQMFGEIVGAWLAHMWTVLGSPSPVALVELGPGRGTLTADIWRTFALVPGLRDAARIHLVETSPRLRAQQADRLSGLPVEWHETLDEVPAGATLLVANELFDALPIRHLVRRGESWRERRVAFAPEGGLAFVDAEPVEADLGPAFAIAPEGAIAEICEAARAVATAIGRRMADAPGAGLVIDYGYRAAAPGDTLQALKGKRPADPLAAPGEADLTAHVDFGALAEAARAAGADSHGPLAQGSFLTALGIGARAERLRKGGADAGDLGLALERLTGVGAMGDLFKVLALVTPGTATPQPFDIA